MAKSIALAADASRLASLLLSYIPAVCAFVAPRRPGASTAIIDRLSHSRALSVVRGWTVTEPRLGRPLLYCATGLLLALLLAVAAARFYEPPNLLGSSGTSLWLEADFLCSLGSGGLALLVAWSAGRLIVRARRFGRLLVHASIWFALTVGLFALWGQYAFLFTLLIAPSHAFAALRLALLWQAWRTEVAWRAQ